MKTITILTTCLFLLLMPHPATSQIPAIYGRVTNANSKEPIAGACIVIRENNQGTVTNEDGEFSITYTPSETVTISVSHLGYTTHNQTIDTKAGSSTPLTIQLTNNDTTLQEIVVTGTGTEHLAEVAPVKTEVITRKMISEIGARDIEEVLGTLSPSFTYNKSDMGSNLKINGLKNDYILIMIDGKRMNGDIGGQNDLARINMSQVERIEIVKGAASSLYGSDAMGGVINIITKKNDDRTTISNTSRLGQYNDINQSNSISIKRGRWNCTTAADYKHCDGWSNTNEEWYRNKLVHNSVTRTVNRSSNYGVSEKIGYQASQNLSFQGNASYYEKWTSRPLGIPQWRLNDLYYRNQDYAMGCKYLMGERNILTADASYGQYNYYYDYNSREYTDYFDSEGNRIVYYPNDRILQSSQDQWMGNIKGVFYLGHSHTFSCGVEYLDQLLRAPFRLPSNQAETYSTSAYAQEEWKINNSLHITAGLRFSHFKETGQSITPKITGMYKWKATALRVTYSRGFKTPTIKELYYQYYASLMSTFKAYYGNTGLKPQTSDYYALNVETNNQRLKISATAYYNRIKDMIALQTIPTSYEDKLLQVEQTMRYVNMAKAFTTGLDITAEIKLPYQFSLSAGYSYLDAQAQRTDDDAASDYMKYKKINGTATHHTTLRATWTHNWKDYKLGININARHQSKTYYLSDGDAKGFLIWRLNTSHQMVKTKRWWLEANAGIDNIFNEIDRTPHGRNKATTSPGRTVFGTINITYKNK